MKYLPSAISIYLWNPPTKPMDIFGPIGITNGAASKKIGLTGNQMKI